MVFVMLMLLALAFAFWAYERDKKTKTIRQSRKASSNAKLAPPPGVGLETTRGVHPEPGTRTPTSYMPPPKTVIANREVTVKVTGPTHSSPESRPPTPSSNIWLSRSGPEKLPELMGNDGLPALRLRKMTVGGETALRLCHVGTGRWTVEGDTRLPRAGIWAAKLRGTAHHQAQIRKAGLTLGGPVQLVREPNNPYDPYAVAVVCNGQRVGYYNKAKAKRLAKLLDDGVTFDAVCVEPDRVWVVAAESHVMAHLQSPWPAGAPEPAR